jgi:xylulokinase
MAAGRRAVIALDLGTGSCKGALYSCEGERLALAGRDYPVHRPAPHFVEQDPADYLSAARAVSRELAGLGVDIAAVGLSTQTPTLVFLDESGAALGPAIIWEDTRAGEESEWWTGQVGEDTRHKWFGLDLPIGAASTPAKLLWVLRNRPEFWARTRWIVQPKDYLGFDLTGRLCTDRWCAKGIAHLATGEVHPAYLALLEKTLPPSPPVQSPDAVSGPLTAEAAPRYGLPEGIPVINGWSDALAGILASGAFHQERRGFVLAGTSEIIGLSRAGGPQSKGLFAVPAGLIELGAAPRLELHYGPTQAGGATLDWLCRLFGRTAPEILQMLREPESETARRILFRPHLTGERAPYWDHQLCAGFEGLRVEHGMADLARAALRGVALQERVVLEAAELSEPAGEVALAGGAARDPGWNRLRADVLQRKLIVLSDAEASLRGAALLAWTALDAAMLSGRAQKWFGGEVIWPDREFAQPATWLMERFRAALPK